MLLRYPLIDSQKDIVARYRGGVEQFAILLAFEACPLNGVNIMAWKTVPEIHRKALIQPDLHSILASKDSFASSSACTAISRVTVGN